MVLIQVFLSSLILVNGSRDFSLKIDLFNSNLFLLGKKEIFFSLLRLKFKSILHSLIDSTATLVIVSEKKSMKDRIS